MTGEPFPAEEVMLNLSPAQSPIAPPVKISCFSFIFD
jgi:hypothetical protein